MSLIRVCKLTLFGACVFLGACAPTGSLVPARLGASGGPPARTSESQPQWEHLCYQYPDSDVPSEWLDKAGEEGWELVSSTERTKSGVVLLLCFKRPRVETVNPGS